MVRLNSSFDTRQRSELSFYCHQFEVHLTVRSKVMIVSLNFGLHESHDEAVEDIKTGRSILIPWCHAKLTGEHGKSLFHDLRGPKSHHKVQNPHGRLYTQFLQFNKPLLMAMLYSIVLFQVFSQVRRNGRKSFDFGFIYDLYSFFDYVFFNHV